MKLEQKRVLVLDDESALRTSLFRTFDRKGYSVLTASKIQEALSLAAGSPKLDLAIVDLSLPDGDGIAFMDAVKALHPECQVIILTGNGSVQTAVHATQKGAFHFITKPFNLEELVSISEKALSIRELQLQNKNLKQALTRKYNFDQIVGQSSEIQSVLGMVERVADSDSTVLITGDSGTGKELIARAIHFNSDRSDMPFVAINCGAIPPELLESELFGHVKGAFTGAIANRIGRFEMADGGTLFLDEIGDMNPSLQVKILRVLQERSFEPVGGAKSISVNVRVIAATHVNLEEAVAKGKFREDLYYRLNVIPISIPSLKERRSDIPLLLNHFKDHFNKTKNKNLTGFTSRCLESLVNYSWPGNIRELENLVERLAILKGFGEVDTQDLPTKYQVEGTQTQISSANLNLNLTDAGMDFNTAVDQYENSLILKALEKTGWNRNQAAALLRLNRTTLVEKIKKKGLRPPDSETSEI